VGLPKPYPGRILLFRATDPDPLAGPAEQARPPATDPTLGWSEISSYPVEAVEVPGYHAALLFEPFVGAVAGRLRTRIAEEEESYTPREEAP